MKKILIVLILLISYSAKAQFIGEATVPLRRGEKVGALLFITADPQIEALTFKIIRGNYKNALCMGKPSKFGISPDSTGFICINDTTSIKVKQKKHNFIWPLVIEVRKQPGNKLYRKESYPLKLTIIN